MRTVSTGRALFLSLAAIVLSFFAATTYTHVRTGEIDRLAAELSADTSPSIRELSEIRTEIRRIQVLLNGHLFQPASPMPDTQRQRAAIEDARRAYARHIDEYLRLPVLPGERDLWREVSTELRAFDDVLVRVLSLVDLNHLDAAHGVTDRELAKQADAAAIAIARTVDFNVGHTSRIAGEIRSMRANTVRVAYGLDIVCALVACAMGVLLLRALRRYTNLLESQRTELARRNQELEQFAGRVAHDILSPLTTAAMALEVAEKRSQQDGHQLGVFGAGRRSIARVQRVVDALLEFARAGARPCAGAQAWVGEVLDDVLAGQRPAAVSAGVELRMEGTFDYGVPCSSGALTSVLSNLIANAIKYVGDGHARRVTVRERLAADRVRIEVADTGPGLPPKLEQDVFEPYVRAPGANRPGIGLGLATVSRIVRSHGGNVGVDSQPGNGCVFWFELARLPRSEMQSETGLTSGTRSETGPCSEKYGEESPRSSSNPRREAAIGAASGQIPLPSATAPAAVTRR